LANQSESSSRAHYAVFSSWRAVGSISCSHFFEDCKRIPDVAELSYFISTLTALSI
jgi:hypothetical protein